MAVHTKHIHCIGIGGIGISALARWHREEGVHISWSDGTDSALISDMKKSGMDIWIWLAPENIHADIDAVIYTEAIITKPDIDPDKQVRSHPELAAALDLGIPIQSYPEALWELTKKIPTIAVTGTHGKSTTTSMIGVATKYLHMPASTIVGTLVPDFNNTNMHHGGDELLTIEACEYKRSFLNYTPEILVITNIELDHLDYYRDMDDYLSAFVSLQAQTIKITVLNALDTGCQKLQDTTRTQAWVNMDSYTLVQPNGTTETHNIPKLHIYVPGEHIYLDACLAYTALVLQWVSPEDAATGVSKYRSSWRRMETLGITQQGNILMSDYGHHPSEIIPTLTAIKNSHPNRQLVVAFQPHQYSRTIELLEGFVESFQSADILLIPNIYFSRDSQSDVEKMPTELFVEHLRISNKQVKHTRSLIETFWELQMLDTQKSNTYVFVIMGAGDVDNIRYMDWKMETNSNL